MNNCPELGTAKPAPSVRLWVVSPLGSNAAKVRYLRV